jgi:ubiquinone/menaquinone biosynthesis C-methylase UbiE
MMNESARFHDNEKKAQVQDYFSRTADNYVASVSHRTGSDLQRLIALGEWETQQQALDIATGGGHTALAVAPHVEHITVSDLTPRMLEKARHFLLTQGVTNATFVEADAEQLPFADASFDRVTCRIAPHHFPNIARFVKEVARVLKNGGLFLLIDSVAPADPELDRFDNSVEKWRDASHERSCTVAEWHTFFAQAGLDVEYEEIFRRTHDYDDWTARAQMPGEEKEKLARVILASSATIQRYFSVTNRPDGSLESISMDYVLLKGRKKEPLVK